MGNGPLKAGNRELGIRCAKVKGGKVRFFVVFLSLNSLRKQA